MPGNLGTAALTLVVKGAKYAAGLKKAETQAKTTGDKVETQGKRMGTAFSNFGEKVKSSAGKIPLVGGALTQLLTPLGAATLAIGALVGGLTSSVTKILDVEKELRPMIQRSGLAATSLQVLTTAAERLGSEDGLEGVTDSSQELQLRMADAVAGSETMADRFDALGLSADDLITKSPEEAFLAVITAIQDLNLEADRKFNADELMGGSSEKLSGIINASTVEFQALTAAIRDNGDIIDDEALAAAKQFDAQWKIVSATLGRVKTFIGTVLLTEILNFTDSIKAHYVELRDGFNAGWNTALDVVLNSLRGMVTAYNDTIGRIPGVAKIDMEKIEASIESMRQKTHDSSVSMGTSSDAASGSFQDMGDATEAVATQAETALQSMADDADASATAMGVTSAAFQAEEVAKEKGFPS